MATSNERLQMLMAAHYEFVKAAGLPEGARPYGVQTRLDTIEKQIMEELDSSKTSTPPATSSKTDNDDIPF